LLADRTVDDLGANDVWVKSANPSNSGPPRFATIQLVMCAEGPQPPVSLIFFGSGKRVDKEKSQYDPSVHVFFQKKAWMDDEVAALWVKQTFAPYLRRRAAARVAAAAAAAAAAAGASTSAAGASSSAAGASTSAAGASGSRALSRVPTISDAIEDGYTSDSDGDVVSELGEPPSLASSVCDSEDEEADLPDLASPWGRMASMGEEEEDFSMEMEMLGSPPLGFGEGPMARARAAARRSLRDGNMSDLDDDDHCEIVELPEMMCDAADTSPFATMYVETVFTGFSYRLHNIILL
jgi:hypothetical protein